MSNVDESQNEIEADYQAWLKAKKITCNTTFQDYIEVDNELYTTGFPTDDDIVEQICIEPEDPVLSGTESDGEGSLEETIHQPSKADVENSLRTLNLFLQTNDRTTEEHYKALNKLEIFYTENNKKKYIFSHLFQNISIHFNLLITLYSMLRYAVFSYCLF